MQILRPSVLRTRSRLTLVGSVVTLILSLQPAQDARAASFVCTPKNVATFSTRVHVLCSTAAEAKFSYFAVCTADDPGFAARMLSVFTSARALGKTILVYYDSEDTSGADCGCETTNCRATTGAELLP